jgi:hypothetical protein
MIYHVTYIIKHVRDHSDPKVRQARAFSAKKLVRLLRLLGLKEKRADMKDFLRGTILDLEAKLGNRPNAG